MNRVTFLLFGCLAATSFAHHQLTCDAASHVGRWWYNACEERCVCESITDPNMGTEYVWKCYRERKEFTCMSAAERLRFIDTFKTVSTPGHPVYAQYQTLLARHASGFGSIHSTDNFLPWHRWFARAMEDLLRQVDCRVTLPWWRWSKKSSNPFTGSPFLNSPSWLGTDGVSSCVQDGPFATSIWNPPNVACLNRNLGGTMPTLAQITNVLNLPATNFQSFSDSLEVQIHNTPHVRIGGTMVTGNSPDAPEFFMHHGYIDQLWDRWQKKSNAHLNSYNCGSCNMNTAMDYAQGATPADVFDLKSTGVMYVSYSRNTAGSGHFSLLPSCMRISVPWTPLEFADRLVPRVATFNIEDIEVAMLKNADSANQVPQVLHQVATPEEQRQWMMVLLKSEESDEQKERAMAEMEKKFELNRRQVQMTNTRGLEDPRKQGDFDDEYSQQYGMDLQYVAKAYGVKPIEVQVYEEDCGRGEEWDAKERRCVIVSCDSPNACPKDAVCRNKRQECEHSGPCPQFVCIPLLTTVDTLVERTWSMAEAVVVDTTPTTVRDTTPPALDTTPPMLDLKKLLRRKSRG